MTLVEDLYQQVTALSRAARQPSSEKAKAKQLRELGETTTLLAAAPALQPSDLVAKLTVLCARLREDLHPEVQDELVTYLLAEAVREDCRVLFDGSPASSRVAAR